MKAVQKLEEAAPGSAIRGLAVPRVGTAIRAMTVAAPRGFGWPAPRPGSLSPLLFCPLSKFKFRCFRTTKLQTILKKLNQPKLFFI
jgi:hypothetical protein